MNKLKQLLYYVPEVIEECTDLFGLEPTKENLLKIWNNYSDEVIRITQGYVIGKGFSV